MENRAPITGRAPISVWALVLVLVLGTGCARFFQKPAVSEEAIRAEKVKKPRFPKPASASSAPVVKPDIMEEQLARTRTLLENKQYADIPPLTASILEQNPDHAEARELNNFAYYQLGKQLYDDNKYIASIEMFGHVSPDYKDTEEILASIRIKMENQADLFYKQGVKYYINEELQRAIAEWRRVLALDPDHPKAAEDIANAQRLLKKLKNID